MTPDLVRPPKARPGDHIAVVSPSFAAAGAFPAVHWYGPSRAVTGSAWAAASKSSSRS